MLWSGHLHVRPANMSRPPQFSASFILLQQEGHLISSCLATGLTELRHASVQNKGAFYSSLFNLSIGLERFLKSIVIMDFMTKNQLRVPSKAQLKGFGHDILGLYDSCELISNAETTTLAKRAALDPLTLEIFEILNDFAQTTRYHNLDALSAAQAGNDPLAHWNEVILKLLRSDVPRKRQEAILVAAGARTSLLAGRTAVQMQGLDKTDLTLEQALSLPGLHSEAVKYGILRLLSVLCPIRDLIADISHKAYTMGLERPPFPQMQEFLQWLSDDPAYARKKMRWP